MAKIEVLDRKADVVLIGGRYTPEHRSRIKTWVEKNMPQAKIAKPRVMIILKQ